LTPDTVLQSVDPSQPTDGVEFPDNKLLIDLCGEFDKNLVQIETALEVEIIRRGNRLTVSSASADLNSNCKQLLRAMYDRLQQGKSLNSGDIDGLIRMQSAAGAVLKSARERKPSSHAPPHKRK